MNEVSCRSCAWVLRWLEASDIAPDLWVVGLPVRLEELRDPDQWIDWDLCISLCERLERIGEQQGSLLQLGRKLAEQVLVPEQLPDSLRGVSPTEIYLHHAPEILGALFPDLTYQIEHQAKQDLTLRLELPQRIAPPRAFFELCTGFLERVPVLLEMPAAKVEADASSHRAHFAISQPRAETSTETSPGASATAAHPWLEAIGADLAAATTPAAVAETLLAVLREDLECPAASLWLRWDREEEATLIGSFGSTEAAPCRTLAIGPEDSPLGHLELWDPQSEAADYPHSLEQLLPWVSLVLENLRTRAGTAPLPRAGSDGSPRHSAEALRTLLENTRDVIWELERDGRLDYVAPQVCELLGRPAEHFHGKSFIEFVLPEDRERVLEGLDKLLVSGEAKDLSFRSPHSDGSILHLQASVRPFRSGDDGLRLACVVRDVTEQQQREARLRESRDRYRSIVESSSDLTGVTNSEGEILFVGPHVERTLRLPQSDNLGDEILKRIHPDDIESLTQAWRVTRAVGEAGSSDLRLLSGDTYRWYELSWRPFRDNGRRDLLSLVMHDITERKRAELALGAIAEGLSDKDEPFERSLVQHLATALQMDFTLLAALDEQRPGFAQTLAVWGDGEFRDNFSYELGGTPCRNPAAGESCSYPTGLQRLFPRIAEMLPPELDSYVGMPICDASGHPIALLCALGRRPLARPDWTRSMLRIFTQRARGELERRQAEQALRASTERYQALADNAGDVIIELSADHGIHYVSPSVERILGYRLDEVPSLENARKRIAEADFVRLHVALLPLLESEDAAQLTFQAQHADGSWRWLDATCRSFRSAQGELRAVVVCRDITERVCAEREREQLVSIAQNSSDLIALASRDGSLLFVNEAGQKLLGLESESAARSKSLFDFLTEEYREAMRFRIMPLVQREQHWSGEVRLRHFKTGESIPTLANFFLVPDPGGGQPRTIAAICRDITDHKRAELALRESEVRYRMLAENPYDLVSEVDAYGHFVYVSPNFRSVLDYSPEELLGRDAFPLIHPDHREQVRQAFERAISEEGTTYGSFRFRHRNGSYRWVDTTVRAYRAASDQIMAVLISRDVTQRKDAEEALRQTEEHLRQAQKMEAIGRLAGGIAHDFNNLLTAITGYCDLLLEELGSQHPARADAEAILKASERAGALTHQLLAFSRRQLLQPKVLDLNTLVADIDRMLRRLIGEDIELVSLLEGELCPVKADPGQLQQVILNLVVNARDAMPRGGRISLETANTLVQEGDAANEDGIPPGTYVALSVQDTGVGMDPDTLSRIWEPFFTTKEHGKGTGLGLSTVHGIIKQSGGHLRVESKPGSGSTFTVYLPQVEPIAMLPERRMKMNQFRGTETVLLVEDADPVRKLITRYLQHHGYKVLDAASGTEALRYCARYAGEIHLLLTDVVLPKMGGPEIAQRFVEVRPEVRVIYISGFSDELLSQHGVISDDIVLLQKPFTPPALLRTVRETLDRPTPPALAPYNGVHGPKVDDSDASASGIGDDPDLEALEQPESADGSHGGGGSSA